ncbi:TPA: HEPN domain-containing protein [Streptococcus agalactiae]|nr:HEPN domain-containing protein [Streptococcus agalactiae]HEO2248525.1 hypothetical protein [Streptococcus agalactiae 515]KLJ85577.1 hypothetical protein WB01_05310 [Streptococcus agalactiae]HEO0550466.1 hypothetical protein [Streptococcus agalactiae]HEO2753454.1 hypothetical protein [Streptococcus agalactiae]HEO6282730.1 hypothetical protein [Streptococcus agalactiae]
MKFKDYTWDKEFEIKGYFSESPRGISDNNDSLSGILHYSPREIILELFGEFPDNNGISFGFGKHLEKIYGFSSNGKILILNTYAEPFGNTTMPGFPITKYHVKNFKLYDVYYNEMENFNFNADSFESLITKLEYEQTIEYKFSFDHIEEWIDKSLVAFKRKENQAIFESRINEYQSTKVLINALGITLEDIAILNTSYTTKSFKSDYFIKFKSENTEAKSFDEFYKASIKFKEFIEILSNIPLSFTDTEFIVDFKMIKDKRLPLIRGKYFVQHARKFKKWKKFSQQEISLRNIESDFDKIINHWFNKSEELEFIVREFSKNLHGDLYLEDQLVDAIRNLEVYSRNFMNFKISQKLSDGEQKSRQALLDFINTSILEEFRKKLRNKLKFRSREPILTERLKKLFDSIDESNKDKIFSKYSDIELLIKKLVQTRNYHTHGDSPKNYPLMIRDFNEMYETKLLLQEVLRFYIYEELDMKYDYNNT